MLFEASFRCRLAFFPTAESERISFCYFPDRDSRTLALSSIRGADEHQMLNMVWLSS